MLTLSDMTATEVGTDYGDDEDMRWRGAAQKYLATVVDRTYLVKPDNGWPSNRDHERVAAAYYRAMRQPVPNVINATIGGTDACAVRILHNAYPIGDDFGTLSPTESADVFRGLILSSLIGDRDRHQYNWIHDGTRAYAIDHGLAFAPQSPYYDIPGPRISSFATEYVYTMLDSGSITLADMALIVADMPTDAPRIAALAWSHVGRASGADDLPDDMRAYAAHYLEAIRDDYNGGQLLTGDDWYDGWMPDTDPDPDDGCTCADCVGQVTDPPMTWITIDGEDRWMPRPATVLRNILRCGLDSPANAIVPHHHRWTTIRGWHSDPLTYVDRCRCPLCYRPAGRMAGKLCPTGHPFPRKVSDIARA